MRAPFSVLFQSTTCAAFHGAHRLSRHQTGGPERRCKAKYDLSCLRILFLAGERADPDTIYWAQDVLNVPVIDHWWQTETGWTIAGNPMGIEPLPVKIGSPSVAMLAMTSKFWTKMAQFYLQIPGAIAVKLPPTRHLPDALERRGALQNILSGKIPWLL